MPFVHFKTPSGQLLGEVECYRQGWHKIPLTITVRLLPDGDQLPAQLLALEKGEVVGVYRMSHQIEGGAANVEMQLQPRDLAEEMLKHSELIYGGTQASVLAAGFGAVAPESTVVTDAAVIKG